MSSETKTMPGAGAAKHAPPPGVARLPDDTVPLVVGVTGHRDLLPGEMPELRRRTRAFLQELQAQHPDLPLVVMYNNYTVPKESAALSIVSDLVAFFADRVADCEALGVRHLILDPGYGFGKSVPESLTVLQNLPLLATPA